MKKLHSLVVMFALVGTTFVSCEKDDEAAANSMTIIGTFQVGENQYTNPTFNLGNPDDHEGYLVSFIGKKVENGMIIEPIMNIDLGNNLYANYEMEIYTAQPGTSTMYCNVSIYEGMVDKKYIADFYLVSQDADVTVTKVGAVGDYIEGTYEGDFYEPTKKEIPPFHIKGNFKVKRIEAPVYNK